MEDLAQRLKNSSSPAEKKQRGEALVKLATPAFVRRLATDERVSAEEVHGLRQEVPALPRLAALRESN